MTGAKVVLWRPMYDPTGHALLAEGGARVVVVDNSAADAVKAELADADALWVRTPERVTADILAAAPKLQVVSTSGFGTDNVDLAAATAQGTLVVNHPGFGRIPVAEHTILLMLATVKQLVWSDAASRDGTAWEKRTALELYELEGKTVGLVGLGFIGSEVARKLALAFRCKVLAYDPHVDPRIPLVTDVEMHGNLEAMLAKCDMLCLCPELTDETRRMIGAEQLAVLPKGAFVVNSSRGQVLDLDALAAALDSGHIAAAGLDVVFPEPLPQGHPILTHPRVTVTPHTGGLTVETSARLARSAADQILAALRGDLPRYPVNPAAWQGQASRRAGAR